MRVELAEEDDGMKTSIALKLWVEDPRRLKGKYRDGGAIEFTFDLEKEVPEAVAQEMVRVLVTRICCASCLCEQTRSESSFLRELIVNQF